MSIFIHLNSRDSIDKNSPSNASFNLSTTIVDSKSNTIELDVVSFPNAVTPVNSNYNTLVYEEDNASSTTTSTLTQQNYSGSQLATELQTQMNADTQETITYSVSYNTQTKKLTIATDGKNFKITSASTCLHIIGVETAGMSAVSTNTALTNPVRLDGTAFVDVVSNLTTRNVVSSGLTNILERIYLTASFGEVQFYIASSSRKMPLYNRDLKSLEFRLLDDRGNLWTLPENQHISYSFKFS